MTDADRLRAQKASSTDARYHEDMARDTERQIGWLEAFSEMTGMVRQLAFIHRARGFQPANYLDALDDVIKGMSAMAERRKK